MQEIPDNKEPAPYTDAIKPRPQSKQSALNRKATVATASAVPSHTPVLPMLPLPPVAAGFLLQVAGAALDVAPGIRVAVSKSADGRLVVSLDLAPST